MFLGKLAIYRLLKSWMRIEARGRVPEKENYIQGYM